MDGDQPSQRGAGGLVRADAIDQLLDQGVVDGGAPDVGGHGGSLMRA
jgi:hypothetical protein